MKNVALMVDSSADITKEQEKELNLHVLRMPVIVDGKEYIEAETIQDEDVIEALAQKKSVKTAQPIVGDLIKMWEDLLKDYDEIFYLPLSNALSGTNNTALQLAANYQGRVTVVDSEFVCYPIVSMMLMVKEMLEKGYSCPQIKEKIEKEGELLAVLIPENLDALKAGGRISPAVAAIAGLLKIVPLLNIKHGAIDLEDKVRTLKKAYQRGVEMVTQDVDPKDYIWMVIDAFDPQKSEDCKKLLEQATGQPVEQHSFKTVILSHTGKGTIGFGRIKKLKY